MHHFFKYSLLTLAGLATLGGAACSSNHELKQEVAKRVAAPAWMVKRPVSAGPFVITAFERMHERGEPVTLYIEGNGHGPMNNDELFIDPTPSNPVALHLAAMDKSDNLAYLARPCHYTGLHDEMADCGEYWGDGQYSATVLNAYDQILTEMKNRYGTSGFHLVGYDGGATLAAMLAGHRADVKTLRTVAGHFDVNALSPYTAKLANIPQHHFTGGQDPEAPPQNVHQYLQALGGTPCAEHTLIQEAEHSKGWVNKWPELLRTQTPECNIPAPPKFMPVEPKPVYSPRIGGAKK